MRGVERDDVGARAGLESDDRLRQRLGAAGQRVVEQRAPGRAAGTAGEHIALAMLQPLAIFELTQLVGDADQHVGIGADAERGRRRREIPAPEKCRRRGSLR